MSGNGRRSKAKRSAPWGRDVKVEFEDGIAWVIFNRPEKRNALSADLAVEMLDTLDALEGDDRCGVLVFTGAGEAWSAGMDLKDYFRATDNVPPAARGASIGRTGAGSGAACCTITKPTIAMVNGWCFGGAFTPLIACDLAIAAEDAMFGVSEINWGIIPGGVVSKAVSTV